MVVGLLVAGICLVLAGVLAAGFGFPVKEFSFGNTLILVGAMGVCSGALMVALAFAVRELKLIARRVGGGLPESRGEITVRPVLPPSVAREVAPTDSVALPGREPTAIPTVPSPEPPTPWQDEATSRAPAPPEPAEPPKTKRNLLFSSTSRKERERAQARTSEPLAPDLLSAEIRPNPADAPTSAPAAEPPPATFDDAWPKSDRGRPGDNPPQRRSVKPPVAPEAESVPSGVTVLKSGVVDGMAYSLYSDGSIEAQMPEGMMRFASIDELRTHLDQRP